MKKITRIPIIFVTRKYSDSIYIAHRLKSQQILDAIVFETRGKQEDKKLGVISVISRFTHILLYFSDILSIVILNTLISKSFDRSFGKYILPKVPTYYISDINDDKAIQLVSKYKKKIVIVYGTSIIKNKFLSQPYMKVLNIHTGIVPQYRNVHSECWAIHNKDFQNIGSLIMYVDSGIDTGDIALQGRIQYSSEDNLFSIKRKNIVLAADLIVQTVKNIYEKRDKRVKQRSDLKGYYKTPGFVNIIAFIIKQLI